HVDTPYFGFVALKYTVSTWLFYIFFFMHFILQLTKNGGHQPMLTDVSSFTLRKEKEQIQL
ncbi:hypothetical protein SAMN04489868_1381, partial [Pisciglobus halotolerans]